jgi:hypothetical protein
MLEDISSWPRDRSEVRVRRTMSAAGEEEEHGCLLEGRSFPDLSL